LDNDLGEERRRARDFFVDARDRGGHARLLLVREPARRLGEV
jgi:hypothetical protein